MCQSIFLIWLGHHGFSAVNTDAAQGGVGGATLGTGAAVDVAGVARGATENAECDGVGQLSDPLEGHVI